MQGIGVINAASPAMGLLTNSGPQPWHPVHQETKEICKEASEYCKVRIGSFTFQIKSPDVLNWTVSYLSG